MLDGVIIALATGIVFRLTKNKGYNAVAFGMGTLIITVLGAIIGAYILGVIGDFLGAFVGGVLMEEIVRNLPARQQIFCTQCGLKQYWKDNKLCEVCGAPLRQ